MKKIELEHEQSNDKWYLFIDGIMYGKFYDLSSALKGVKEEYEAIIREERKT